MIIGVHLQNLFVVFYSRGIIVTPNEVKQEVIADRATTLQYRLDTARMGKWTEDYSTAIENYKKVLEMDPNNQEAKESIEEINKLTSAIIESKAAFYSDKEDFSADSYGLSYSLYPSYSTLIKTGYSYSYFSQHDLSFYKNAYSLETKYRISEKLVGGLGYIFNDYCRKINDDSSYMGNLYYQALKDTGLYFSFGHFRIIDTHETFSEYGWNIINDIDAGFSEIETYDYKLALNQKIQDNLSFLASFNFGDYSDGNRKIDIFAELDNILRKENPELHLKYNYYALDYSKASANYWAPSFFDVHSLVFEFKDKLTERLNVISRVSVSYLSKVQDVGFSGMGKLVYDLNKDWQMNVSGFYARSAREGESDFWSSKFTFSILRRF